MREPLLVVCISLAIAVCGGTTSAEDLSTIDDQDPVLSSPSSVSPKSTQTDLLSGASHQLDLDELVRYDGEAFGIVDNGVHMVLFHDEIGNLVDHPVGRQMEHNGIDYVEYTGEISGSCYDSTWYVTYGNYGPHPETGEIVDFNAIQLGYDEYEQVTGPEISVGLPWTGITQVPVGPDVIAYMNPYVLDEIFLPNDGVPAPIEPDPDNPPQNGTWYVDISGFLGLALHSLWLESSVARPIVFHAPALNEPLWPIAAKPVDKRYWRTAANIGVPFTLLVPGDWNGKLLVSSLPYSNSPLMTWFRHYDPLYMVSLGYADFAIHPGWGTATETDYRQSEFWQTIEEGDDWRHYSYIAPFWDQEQLGSERLSGTGLNSALTAYRDITKVMKNLLAAEHGQETSMVFLSGVSGGSVLPAAALTGSAWTDPSGNTYRNGGNFVEDPIVTGNPNPEPLFHGILAYSPVSPFQYDFPASGQNPNKSPAVLVGSNSDWVNGGVVNGPGFLVKVHEMPEYDESLYRFYMNELTPNVPGDSTFAWAEQSSSGWYFDKDDADLATAYNQEGRGRPLSIFLGRILDYTGPPSDLSEALGWTSWAYFNQTAPRNSGFFVQMLTNFAAYWDEGTPLPASLIDPYWLDGNTIYPQLTVIPHTDEPMLYLTPPYLDVMTRSEGVVSIDQRTEGALGYDFGVRYRDADGQIQHLVGSEIFNYINLYVDHTPESIKLPDVAARLGMFVSDDGFTQRRYYDFSDDELRDGYLTQRIVGYANIQYSDPDLGIVSFADPVYENVLYGAYRNHGQYLKKVKDAVGYLEARGLFDKEIGKAMTLEAAKSDILDGSP